MFCLVMILFLVGVRVELKKFLKESLKEVIPAIENLDTQPYSKDIDRKYIKISICPGACMAFIGSDVCDLRRCKFCNLKRYSPCTYLSCRYRNYDDCPHRDDVKTPKKNVFYRPLLPLLKDLLETKYFSDYCAHALKYVTHGDFITFKFFIINNTEFRQHTSAVNVDVKLWIFSWH